MIEEIIIKSAEDKYNPPSMLCLSVAVIGEQIHLATVKYSYDAPEATTSYQTIKQVAVRLDDLLAAIHTFQHEEKIEVIYE